MLSVTKNVLYMLSVITLDVVMQSVLCLLNTEKAVHSVIFIRNPKLWDMDLNVNQNLTCKVITLRSKLRQNNFVRNG